MGYQEVIAYGLVILAVAVLIKKAVWKKKKDDSSCGNGGCGCS